MKPLAHVLRFLVIAAGLLAVFSGSEKMMHSSLAHGDLESYLHAARSIVAGEDIYATPSRPLNQGGLFYVYPPLFSVLFIPLTLVPVPVAIVVWSVLNLVLLAWVTTAFYKAMTGKPLSSLRFEDRWIFLFLALLPPSRFILHHFFYGQANIFVMALTVFGLKHISSGKPLLGAVPIGLSVVIKIINYPIAFWFLLRKSGRTVAGILAGGAAGAILPALVLGFGTNWSYLRYWLTHLVLSNDLNTWKIPLFVNISVQAQLYRFFGRAVAFTYDGRPYQMTLFRLTDTALRDWETVLTLSLFAIVALYVFRFRNAAPFSSYRGGAALTLGLASILTPSAQKHYLILLVPAFLFLAHVWYFLSLRDKLFQSVVVVSALLLIFTNEEICGEYLGAVFSGVGAVAWGTLLACAAIFRAACCLERVSPPSSYGIGEMGSPRSPEP